MKGCAVLLTTGHCASSLAIRILRDQGYSVGEPGLVDGRHPEGTFHYMDLLQPQIDGDWDAYVTAVEEESLFGSRPIAFRLQSGLIHWGVRAIEILPRPVRVIVLDRDEYEKIPTQVGKGGQQWIWEFSRAMWRALYELGRAGYEVEFWHKEELCDPSRGFLLP